MLNTFLTVYFGFAIIVSVLSLILQVDKNGGWRAFRLVVMGSELALIAAIWGVFG